MTSATMTPDEVIAQIADWQGRQVSWEVLGGGITNLNYLVSVAGPVTSRPRATCCASPARGPTSSSTVSVELATTWPPPRRA